jgi:hypothetical protein
MSDGSYTPNGVNFFAVGSSQTIEGNPFGVSVGAQTFNQRVCKPMDVGGVIKSKCTSSSSYDTFPVISLYSLNQVLIGETAVSVGLNPTAVATYQAASVSRTY